MLQDTGTTDFSRMSDHIVLAFNSSSDDDGDGVRVPDEPMPPLCEGIPRRLWVGKCEVLYKNDGVPVAKIYVATLALTSSLALLVRLEIVMLRFRSPPVCLWRMCRMNGDTQFEHGLWSSSSTTVLVSGTMNYKQNTTPELHCFPSDL